MAVLGPPVVDGWLATDTSVFIPFVLLALAAGVTTASYRSAWWLLYGSVVRDSAARALDAVGETLEADAALPIGERATLGASEPE